MSTYAWKMKADTDQNQEVLRFKIIDNHHAKDFYGGWEAKKQKEIDYHMDGLEECIKRGSYKNNVYELNGKRVSSFSVFNEKIRRYFAA